MATRGRDGSEGGFVPSVSEVQLLLASTKPPHLMTMVPMSAASGYNVHGRPWVTFDFERDWQRSFWGGNYERLRATKRRYDPDGSFFVHHGVGSEDLSENRFTRVAST